MLWKMNGKKIVGLAGVGIRIARSAKHEMAISCPAVVLVSCSRHNTNWCGAHRTRRCCVARLRRCSSCVNVRTCLCHKINIYSNDACKEILAVDFAFASAFHFSFVRNAFSIILDNLIHIVRHSSSHWFTSSSSSEHVFVFAATTEAGETHRKFKMKVSRSLNLDIPIHGYTTRSMNVVCEFTCTYRNACSDSLV